MAQRLSNLRIQHQIRVIESEISKREISALEEQLIEDVRQELQTYSQHDFEVPESGVKHKVFDELSQHWISFTPILKSEEMNSLKRQAPNTDFGFKFKRSI